MQSTVKTTSRDYPKLSLNSMMFRRSILVYLEKKQSRSPNLTSYFLGVELGIRSTPLLMTNTYYLGFFLGSSLYQVKMTYLDYDGLDLLQKYLPSVKIISLDRLPIYGIGTILLLKNISLVKK